MKKIFSIFTISFLIISNFSSTYTLNFGGLVFTNEATINQMRSRFEHGNQQLQQSMRSAFVRGALVAVCVGIIAIQNGIWHREEIEGMYRSVSQKVKRSLKRDTHRAAIS